MYQICGGSKWRHVISATLKVLPRSTSLLNESCDYNSPFHISLLESEAIAYFDNDKTTTYNTFLYIYAAHFNEYTACAHLLADVYAFYYAADN